ncbi:MAG: ChbG/HpnK family deacetylase [Paenacidovorax caeni]
MSKTVTAVDTVHEAPQHSSSWRAIALCVDDYGLNDGVNQAVLALAQLGRVQAVSAMVGGPAWRQGAPALRALDGAAVEVGLHLDLTECALDPALRFPLSRLIARAYLGQLDRNALQREIVAQLDAFEHAMGRAPAYVDGHQHVHQLPVVRTLLLAELARRYPQGAVAARHAQCAARRPRRCAHGLQEPGHCHPGQPCAGHAGAAPGPAAKRLPAGGVRLHRRGRWLPRSPGALAAGRAPGRPADVPCRPAHHAARCAGRRAPG